MTRYLLVFAALAGLLGVTGCQDDPDPANACEFANDGTCDEPTNCAFGTDSADCEAACESEEGLYLIAAACAHRDESLAATAREESYQQPDPSGGTGDEAVSGYVDDTVTVPSGTDDGGDIERFYRVGVPEYYDPDEAYPLVINMAGHRVDHRVLANNTQLPRTASLNDFIVVYAAQEFRESRWAWWTDWDWANETDANPDFVFLRRIIEEVSQDYNIDSRRIYLSGHSRGAAMAFIGAMELRDIIAGAVVQSGFTELNYLNERVQSWDGRKPPLVFIHGVEDDDVCIDCRPGASCGVNPQRSCGQGLHASDAVVERLEELGWERGEHLVYYRLENVAHRWQSQLNQQWWDFLSARPLPSNDQSEASQ
ncbi:MAG: alpha/beta hydrolase family esterase [Myxococcota bacterium]